MIKKLLIKFVKSYQKLISPLIHSIFPIGCKFVPTCSQYLIEAVETHGVLIGFFYGIKRLLKCWPFVKGGLDPVPEKKV